MKEDRHNLYLTLDEGAEHPCGYSQSRQEDDAPGDQPIGTE